MPPRGAKIGVVVVVLMVVGGSLAPQEPGIIKMIYLDVNLRELTGGTTVEILFQPPPHHVTIDSQETDLPGSPILLWKPSSALWPFSGAWQHFCALCVIKVGVRVEI